MMWLLLKVLLVLTLAYWGFRYAIRIGAERAVYIIVKSFSACSGDRSKLNEALRLHSPWYLIDGPSLISGRGFDAEMTTGHVGDALYELAFLQGKPPEEEEVTPAAGLDSYDFENSHRRKAMGTLPGKPSRQGVCAQKS